MDQATKYKGFSLGKVKKLGHDLKVNNFHLLTHAADLTCYKLVFSVLVWVNTHLRMSPGLASASEVQSKELHGVVLFCTWTNTRELRRRKETLPRKQWEIQELEAGFNGRLRTRTEQAAKIKKLVLLE